MKRQLRQIRVWFSLLSREGNIGIGLLGISLIAYFFLLTPATIRLQQLREDVASLSSRAHAAGQHIRPAPATATDELHAFYRYFPPNTSTPDWLEKIFTAAQKEHLVLSEGKYRAKHLRAGPLIRYQIMLPITGNYHQVHEFLANVLTEVPNAALDGVTFERRKIGDTRVEAKVKISLYLGKKP